MIKKLLLLLLCFSTQFFNAQEKEREEKEDLKIEQKHQKASWNKEMQDGVNYFEVKNKYDTYFKKHPFEYSKPRELGASWLMDKIFYLDNQGSVQKAPPYDASRSNFATKNVSVAGVTTSQVGDWTILGPKNSSETGMSGYGNRGGYVILNRIDPTNTQKMFVSYQTGGLWVTTDGGTSWTLTDSSFPDERYIDIDVCTSNPSIVYALSASQLLRSTDGGLNWTTTNFNSSTYGTLYDIAASPSDPLVVVARAGTTIYRTNNGGAFWSTVATSVSAPYVPNGCSLTSENLDWSTTNSSEVYYTKVNGTNVFEVYKSSNSGSNFSLLSSVTLDPTANGQVVAVAKLLLPSNNTSAIYVAAVTGANNGAHNAVSLYKLENTTGAEILKRINILSGIKPATGPTPGVPFGDFAMDRNDENKMFGGGYSHQKCWYSANNGVTFTTTTNTDIHADLRSFDMVSGRALLGTDGSAILSTNGGQTFTCITNSTSNHELWGFGSAFKSGILAVGCNHGPTMIKETYNGYDWFNAQGADQGNNDVNPLDDRHIYAHGYDNYRMFRNAPHSVQTINNLTLDVGGIYSYFNNIEFHPNYYYTMVTHHAGGEPVGHTMLDTWKRSLIKSEDNGMTINVIKTFTNKIFREKICMTKPDYIYVVEGTQLPNATVSKLWRTTDGGVTWTDVTPTLAESSSNVFISDIAVSDVDPAQVWITYSGVQNTAKVLKSTNATSATPTWTNLTQPILTSFPIFKIVFQRGSNGGVYVGNKSGVYYRNNSMLNWVMLGNGLPYAEIRFMFINYNENKLKIGTSRGAFMHDLYEISPPKAQISASTAVITCPSNQTVQYKDYSTVRNASATWSWSFPGGSPSTSTQENPVVSYAGAADGKYNATLTVTDAYGTDTQTITGIVQVLNQCGSPTPEKIPGNVATLKGLTGRDYIDITGLNISNKSVTFSCWIKPNGIQPEFSGLFIGQAGAKGFGLNFIGTNNNLGYHPDYSWDSGLNVPPNQWSHVALVSDGTNVTLYVNGVASAYPTTFATQTYTQFFSGFFGRGQSTDRYYRGEIDEVCIWNRTLSADEIRKWRHLTKTTSGDPILTGLVGYYQFNEATGTITNNKVGANTASLVGSTITHDVSNAPVFDGVSEKLNITAAGVADFSNAGLEITFPTGTVPNGDVWVSRSTINPDTLPDGNINFNPYWNINNYGTNAIVTSPTSLKFTDASLSTASSTASNLNLFGRGSNAFGATWGTLIDTGDARSGSGATSAVTFSTGLNVTSLGQFVMSQSSNLGLGNNLKASDKPIISPNPAKSNSPIHISLPSRWETSTMIVYDMSGKTMGMSSLKPGNNEIILSVPAGLYNISIVNQHEKYNSKLIIK